MQEERAYVEWLRGQEEKKDTKPAVQLVSEKHLIVIQLLFCGEEVEVGSETLADKKTGWRVGWGKQQTDGPIFHCSFFAFSTLHTPKM